MTNKLTIETKPSNMVLSHW